MKLKTLIPAALILAIAPVAYALNPALTDMLSGKPNPAPKALDYDSFTKWSAPILEANDAVSPFTEGAFKWLADERVRGLPNEVYNDRDHIFVDVSGPRAETEAFEDSGEVEKDTTVGANLYAEMDGTVDQVLETMLFRWGKPVGAKEGQTNPEPGNFSARTEFFAPQPEWGPGAYANQSVRKGSGIVKDMNDRYAVLVRGDSSRGYEVLMQFVKRGGKSETTKCIGIAIIAPLANGKTAYKITTRYQGQYYGTLGSWVGKSQFGFNVKNAKEVQLDFIRQLNDLKTKGTIIR